jgi:diamine N-acetyltransferase
MVSLRPITDANRDAVFALRVSEAQQQFVSNVLESLAEAAEEPMGERSTGLSTTTTPRSGS